MREQAITLELPHAAEDDAVESVAFDAPVVGIDDPVVLDAQLGVASSLDTAVLLARRRRENLDDE